MSNASFCRLLQLGGGDTCCSQSQRRVQVTIVFCCCLFMTMFGRQVSAEIVVVSVGTAGTAFTHGLGQNWDESTFGTFSAFGETIGGDYFSASAIANNEFDGSSTFDMSATTSTFYSTNDISTGARSDSTITFTIDREYDYSFTGSQMSSGGGSLDASFMPVGGAAHTRMVHGESGTISPGSYEIRGVASAANFVGDNSTSFTSRLTLTPVPEPTSFGMFGIALAGLARRRRKR